MFEGIVDNPYSPPRASTTNLQCCYTVRHCGPSVDPAPHPQRNSENKPRPHPRSKKESNYCQQPPPPLHKQPQHKKKERENRLQPTKNRNKRRRSKLRQKKRRKNLPSQIHNQGVNVRHSNIRSYLRCAQRVSIRKDNANETQFCFARKWGLGDVCDGEGVAGRTPVRAVGEDRIPL